MPRHQHISFMKSAIRIVGYALIWPVAPGAAVILLVSEALGIIEEIGHD